MKPQRVGKFLMSRWLIETHPKAALVALKNCIVLRAEMLLYCDGIDYVVSCDELPENPPLVMVPEYAVILDEQKGGGFVRRFEPADQNGATVLINRLPPDHMAAVHDIVDRRP